MHKEVIVKEDGRLIILYSFTDATGQKPVSSEKTGLDERPDKSTQESTAT